MVAAAPDSDRNRARPTPEVDRIAVVRPREARGLELCVRSRRAVALVVEPEARDSAPEARRGRDPESAGVTAWSRRWHVRSRLAAEPPGTPGVERRTRRRGCSLQPRQLGRRGRTRGARHKCRLGVRWLAAGRPGDPDAALPVGGHAGLPLLPALGVADRYLRPAVRPSSDGRVSASGATSLRAPGQIENSTGVVPRSRASALAGSGCAPSMRTFAER